MNAGIHFSNKYWELPNEEEFARLRLTRPECIKTCLFPDPRFDQVAVHHRLRQEHPQALIVARLFADMRGGAWRVDDFVTRFQPHIESVRPYVTWFEVHNEPNIDSAQAGYSEGFGPTDQDFQDFALWAEAAFARLRTNHPWARWVFPGNAIHRYYEFWQALLPTIRKFDAWGVHCYWQADRHADPYFGRSYERAHELLPDKPIIITECGDSTVGRSPAEKTPIYLDWFREVDKQPYVLGTALYILGGTQDWINKPGMPNFDVTQEMAVAIGELPRQPCWPLVADGFDFPVAKPDARGYYVAAGLAGQEYRDRFGFWHTGEDWNDLRGGDSDLGAPVYATAHGRVETSDYFRPGWGNVILIEHLLPDGRTVWSQYAHLRDRSVQKGEVVWRGQQIGTIGKGDGDQYPAHLHFEIRTKRLPASRWGWKTEDDREKVLRFYAHPTDFINSHRPGRETVALTVDDVGAGFTRSPSRYWYEAAVGYKGHTWWTWTVSDKEDCVAYWRPQLPRSGLYEVFAFIPSRYATTCQVRYQVTHRRGVETVAINQNDYYDEWVSLGVYPFSTVQESAVRLSDLTGEPYTRDEAARKQIAFDAILWVLVKEEA
jgi:hypothetical protein